MTIEPLAARLSPDVSQTVRRFPFPLLLAGLATLLLIAATTGLLDDSNGMWERITLGLATAAIFATGGALFAETRPKGALADMLVAYVVPVLVFLAWQIEGTEWLLAPVLPVIGVLWTSVSTATAGWRGAARAEAQDRFWWINHLAITSAAIAGAAYLIILVGAFAIGQTVSVLFGLDLGLPLYRIALPATGGFFLPFYWLSTLPRATDYAPGRLDMPNFLIKAVTTIGTFVLIPLLAAYALILLAYALQIVVTQQLPQGTLGWMVLGFVTTGAATWLVLHADFMRDDSLIIRLFRRWWFWATVVPLILYAVAVEVRLSAYGFTPERLLLVWGGIWAAAVTLLFLVKRGDIRLIPALAAICLVFAAVGPWNIVNLSRMQQAASFDALLPITGPAGESYGVTPAWTPAEAERARGALDFLVSSDEGREAVRDILRAKGFEISAAYFDTAAVFGVLGVDILDTMPAEAPLTLMRDGSIPVDVTATPLYIDTVSLYRGNSNIPYAGLGFAIGDNAVRVTRGDEAVATVDLAPWLAAAGQSVLTEPTIPFEVDGRRFALVAASITIAADEAGVPRVYSIYGLLFAGPEVEDAPTPPAAEPGPAAAEPTAQDQPAPGT